MEAICGYCNVGVTIAPAGADDWAWVGADGSTFGTNYPPGYDSPTFWKDLAERDIATYSMLNARDQLCMTGWTHQHYPKTGSRSPFVGNVEECCDLPLRLAPRGWVCRGKCGSVIEMGVERETSKAA